MNEDHETGPVMPGYMLGQQLETLSIEEIGETIERLKEEIRRLEITLGEKTRHRDAADALFGKK